MRRPAVAKSPSIPLVSSAASGRRPTRLRLARSLALLVWLALPAAADVALGVRDAGAEAPSVARAYVRGAAAGGGTPGGEAAGLVFFLRAPGPAGAAAVGAAHSFDLTALAGAGDLELRTGAGDDRVALATRFLVTPGRPFNAPGATLRDDHLVFALDTPPFGVRVLEPAEELPRPGDRVNVLGIPRFGVQQQRVAGGTIHGLSLEHIEVSLDERLNLRGWGGAPVVEAQTGRVLGLLQAASPGGDGLRVTVSPIESVVGALRRPLEGGRGRPFSAFADVARARAAAPRTTPSRTAAPPSQSARRRPVALTPQPALEQAGVPLDLEVEIEYPGEGAVLSNVAGGFLAGRAVAHRGDLRRFDVILVLDTSGSTAEATGVDVNGNGVVGRPVLGSFGRAVGVGGSTDPGDSILAAEVAAARRLLGGLDPRSTRVGLVTFAGEEGARGGLGVGGFSVPLGRPQPPAVTEEPLTQDYVRLERGLDRILARGSAGMTHMAAGVDQATVELLGLRTSEKDPEAERIVLFLTDGQPTLPYDARFSADNVRAVLRAARRAQGAGVRIHSFALGPEALAEPVATVEMANLTDGTFTPVRHPADLVDLIDSVNFANVEEVTVHNLTLDTPAHAVDHHPDGTWNALVPLEVGKNRVEVVVRATDGSERREVVTLQYAPGSAEPTVPPELVPRRNRLLEQRLVEIRQDRREVELEAAEAARRELAIEIERERAAAAERAEQSRRELELEPEARTGDEAGSAVEPAPAR